MQTLADRQVAAGYAVDQSPGAVAPGSFEVVRARDRADVVEVLREAAATRTPVVPQGARTGLAGGAVATEGSIVLNVEALDQIEELDELERFAVVGPGVVNAAVKAAAAKVGLAYPPDPASSASCTIGGNVATNAGGLCCVKYGVTADYVRGLEVVLPGGAVMRTGRRTAKGVAGFDLTGLFVGSEGLLGVLTSVRLRLVPAADPPLTALAVFDSLEEAAAGIVALRSDRPGPSLIEVLDGPSIESLQQLGDFGFPVGCAGAVMVQSDRPGGAHEDVQRYGALLSAAGATDVAVADDGQESDALMAGRRALHSAMERMGPHFNEDLCVPVRRLADLIRTGHRLGEEQDVTVTLSGHGGDGNLHPCVFYSPEDPGSRERAEVAFEGLLRAALEMGGTITGEHGVGSLKAKWLPLELGSAEMERQRAVKAVFDPLGIMNPGKVL